MYIHSLQYIHEYKQYKHINTFYDSVEKKQDE